MSSPLGKMASISLRYLSFAPKPLHRFSLPRYIPPCQPAPDTVKAARIQESTRCVRLACYLSARAAASMVASMSASPWAVETNMASKGDGGR